MPRSWTPSPHHLARAADYGAVMALLLPLWGALCGTTWALLRVAGRPLPLGTILLEALPLYGAMGVVIPLAMWAGRAYPFVSGRRLRSLAIHGGLLPVFGALSYLVERSLYLFMNPSYVGVQSRLTLRSEGPEGLWASLFLATPFYLLAITACQALSSHKGLEERALRAAQLEADFHGTRLEVLKRQLQPHFLFNALNALMGHLPPEAETAQRMVVLLSSFLRRSLQEMGLQCVPLRHELETVNLYLEIQQLRFGDRLRCHCEADEAALDLQVPHLLLQPLVENALKHGLGPKLEPGKVQIEARVRQGLLSLTVQDDGVGPGTRRPQGTGTGLANLRKRLQHLYGDRATLQVGPGASGGFQVCIQLPLSRG